MLHMKLSAQRHCSESALMDSCTRFLQPAHKPCGGSPQDPQQLDALPDLPGNEVRVELVYLHLPQDLKLDRDWAYDLLGRLRM